jgi:hypothetical protein
MFIKMKKVFYAFAVFLTLTFVSCFGFNAGIEVKEKVFVLNLEYRVSALAENLGKLDGNGNWPILPAGRGDFERSTARLPGTRLVSFSSKTEAENLLIQASLEFDTIEALVLYFDAMGENASYKEENGVHVLSLVLHRGEPGGGTEYLSFVRAAFETYSAVLSLKGPGASVSLDGGKGGAAGISGAVLSNGGNTAGGNTASFSMPMGDLLCLDGFLVLEFTWR